MVWERQYDGGHLSPVMFAGPEEQNAMVQNPLALFAVCTGLTVFIVRHEREIISIRERLDYISGVLSIRPRDPHSVFSEEPERISTNNVTGVGDYPLDESIISRKWRNEFPFMTIQTPSMMCFLGLPPRFAAQLVVAERETSSMLIQPGLSLNVEIHEEQSIGAFRAHCYKIHHWYPILHPTFFNTYLEMTKGLLPQSTDLFLSLVTAAIGSVVQCRSFREVQETRPDTIYIERALSILPVVNMEFSLRSVQCLVMLTIYYNCIMKPCQAHDYILMASFKAQGLFKCHFYPDDDINQNLLRRCFWSILMIETDLAYHIDMPESNAWKFDDRILLPEIFESWQPYREYEHHQLDDLRLNENTTKAYFLAAIAMCRMIRRCTTAITISHDKEVYASVIAHELARQLDTWYDRLPESLRFDRTIDQGAQNTAVLSPSSEIPGLTTATKSLKMQYYLCLTGIFWPAVYSAVYVDNIGSEALADCARYFDAYASFVVSAVEALHNYPPSPWSIYAR
ncbi:C6 transcription factor, putative [Glarea lozoyensis ATCC 20868]|uniref:C6 transcription factor, putative n=1 Tax=Glarea lozoyensis (strain ATCC 20868 / MF5171) TaxID=1116229 RepID=S3D957_GLAL2|nr:C6 transcription factor, putative [Glarea lozoyensis ATCC 20868]EPE34245.1 C6 transcription factor, putative [Glarea lozoyensis ATCC 20868]